MKNVGRGPLGRGEAGVKVGDNDLGQMTSKSGEKTFLSRDEILLVQSGGCEAGKFIYVLFFNQMAINTFGNDLVMLMCFRAAPGESQ